MTTKSFFKTRTPAEIKKLDIKEISQPKGLIKIIDSNLDFQTQSLLLTNFSLKPEHLENHPSGKRASRLNRKHGTYLKLPQPTTQKEAAYSRLTPLNHRDQLFQQLRQIPEEEIFYQGIYWYPIMGREQRKRVLPFVSLPVGILKYIYAQNMAGGIELEIYDDAQTVETQGATIIATIPSKSQKRERYTLKFNHVPVKLTPERKFITYSTYSEYTTSNIPEDELYFIRYTSKETSNIFLMGPNTIAGYLKIIDHYWNPENDRKNDVPIEMIPFPIISQKELNLYQKINNNILIQDKTLKSKDQLRKLHLDEISTLLARSIAILGETPRETMYASLKRDGKIKNYTVLIP